MKDLYYKEGAHLIRRTVKLPNYGSPNYLYTILGENEFDYLYRFMPDNTWEKIPLLFGKGTTYIEAGMNVILYGEGTQEDPYIINSVTEAGGELEKIDRGGRGFYRLRGQEDSNYALGGDYSINFSQSTNTTGIMGPTGARSVQFGLNNITSGTNSLTLGTNNINTNNSTIVTGDGYRGKPTNKNRGPNIIVAEKSWDRPVETYDNLYANLISGASMQIGTPGATIQQAVVYNSIIAGDNLEVPSARECLVVGQALKLSASNCAVVGVANEDISLNNGTAVTQDGNKPNPRFIVGVGEWNSHNNTGTRANGFVVMHDGTASFPSLTNPKIDSSNGYSAVTKQWVNHRINQIQLDPFPEAPDNNNYYARRNKGWEEVNSFPEAPNNNKIYGRINLNWQEVNPFPEAPYDNKAYTRKNMAWVEVEEFIDAPQNNTTYGRNNGEWVKVEVDEFPEAPQDGKKYARKDADWTTISEFIDAPNNTNNYVRKGGQWEIMPTPPPFPEAPANGRFYARRNESWSEVVHPPFPEAPQNGKEYARKNANWVEVTDTTYAQGTFQQLMEGTLTTQMLWSPRELKAWVDEMLKPNMISISGEFNLDNTYNNYIVGLDSSVCRIEPSDITAPFSISFKNKTETTSEIVGNYDPDYRYKTNSGPKVQEELVKIPPGRTCTVSVFPGDKTIYIDAHI